MAPRLYIFTCRCTRFTTLNFGLAGVLEKTTKQTTNREDVSKTVSFLLAERAMGTVSYMAPEVVRPSEEDGFTKKVSARVDIWALGVILSQMVNGGLNIFKEHLDRGYMSAM